MIDPKSLRIGNKALLGDSIVTIEEICNDGIETPEHGFVSATQLSGIPLSPSLLERAGFELVNHIHGYSFWNHKKYKIDIYEKQTRWMGFMVKHCEALHDVQNLVERLYGEELELKPLP